MTALRLLNWMTSACAPVVLRAIDRLRDEVGHHGIQQSAHLDHVERRRLVRLLRRERGCGEQRAAEQHCAEQHGAEQHCAEQHGAEQHGAEGGAHAG